jgi:CDP-diacylglycerol--glycerol-3-phosphate 3-phosphatidyltransferase
VNERDRAGLPDRASFRARWAGLHGGADAHGSRAVDTWLRLVETAARPLARREVAPDALTALGVLVAAAAPLASRAGGRWRLAAGAAVVVSGFADGLDGSVAVLSGSESGWGFVLDSLADRASDACHLLALRAAGAPAALAVAAWTATGALEYARARAAGAGFTEIGTITVGERPVRLAVAAAALLAAGAFPDVTSPDATSPTATRLFATWAAAGIAVLGAAGTAQFLRVAAPRLRGLRPA